MAAGPPQAPQSEDPSELGFTPQPMVGWFTPVELVRAGVKSLLSSLFGAYADYREMQAALHQQTFFDYSGQGELWIDYVADVGDGFDSTYAVARLVTESELPLSWEGTTWVTRRGSLLLLGGDEVYPTASSEEYHNRLVGPYRAAFPWGPADQAPHVFAIPGNHDWYDGLTSFTRLFCQDWRWLGGWKTKQKRSYFALKLHDDVWLWGIDVQLGSDVDEPQIAYFKGIARAMRPGSRIILVTAEPSWVYAETDGRDAYRNLALFERQTMLHHDHRVAVGLSGDLHCYARYQEQDGSGQRFVAGGGGAYLYPTHHLPASLELEQPGQGSARYEKKKTYPEARTSRLLTLGSLLFSFKNPLFSLFLGLVYLFYAWIWQSASYVGAKPGCQTLLAQLADLSLDAADVEELFGVLLRSIAHSPQSILLLAALTFGLVAFADCKGMVRKLLVGGLHAGAHLVVLLTSMWVFAVLTLHPSYLSLPLGGGWQTLLFGLGMFLAGGFAGGTVMGLYFFLANRFGYHDNEVFSCQSIPDHKHFLRLHLGSDGKLTIYPIGIDRVPRRRRGGWRLNQAAAAGAPWFEPARGSIGELARLIEEPIEIPLSSS